MPKKTRKQKEKKQARYSNAKETAKKQGSREGFSAIKPPNGVDLWRPTRAGSYRLDVLSYDADSESNPSIEEDCRHYERIFYVHRGIGPNNKQVICPARNFEEPCPICEWIAEAASDPDMDSDNYQDYKVKKRQLFNVFVHDESEKGVQIHEGPFSNGLGEALKDKIDIADEDDPVLAFFHDDENGMTLKILTGENPPYGVKIRSVDFKARKKALSEDLLESVVNLDELVSESALEYDEIKKMFAQTAKEDDDEDEDEKPRKRKKKEAETADDKGIEVGSTVIHDDHGECEVLHISKDGTTLKLEDDDGDVHKGISVEDVDLEEEDEEEEKPKSRRSGKRSSTKSSDDEEEDGEDEDDENEDEEDDEEEEEKPKKSVKKTKRKKAGKKGKKLKKGKEKKKEEEEEDDWDDDDEDWD